MCQVDKLYVAVLELLGESIDQGLVACEAAVFDTLLDVIAPRLSKAASRIVPEAFQSLWSRFENFDLNSFSNETSDFLKSVVSAVPDLITVKGLSIEADVSEVCLSYDFLGGLS